MERYVKANPKVAQYLHLENDRTQLSDGNYLLWMQDILPFGPLTNFSGILSQIGAIALDGASAHDEQEGITCNRLPVALEERFIMDTKAEEA